jgi:replicative DNA helicase
MPQKQTNSRKTKQGATTQKKKPAAKGRRAIIDKSMEDLPPANIEAEQAILGAILLDNSTINYILEDYEPGKFSRYSHTKIFNAMCHLNKEGIPIDLLTLQEKIIQLGGQAELDEIGGPAYLASLIDLVPTAANISAHNKIISEDWVARTVINITTETCLSCYQKEGRDLDEIIAKAQEGLVNVVSGSRRKVVTVGEAISEGEELLDKIYENGNKVSGLPSGYAELDRLLGGYQNAELTIIGARPSMGKTALCLGMLRNAAVQDYPMLIISPEQTPKEIGFKLICQENEINIQDIRSGKVDPRDFHDEINRIMKDLPIIIDPTPGIKLFQIRARIMSCITLYGIKGVLIDYVQLLNTGIKQLDYSNDLRVKNTKVAHALREYAKDGDVPIIGFSQLSRSVENSKTKRPEMSHLKETGAYEEAAHIIHFIYRPEYYGIGGDEKKGVAEIITAKNRNFGQTGTTELLFKTSCGKFSNKYGPAGPHMQIQEDLTAPITQLRNFAKKDQTNQKQPVFKGEKKTEPQRKPARDEVPPHPAENMIEQGYYYEDPGDNWMFP